MQQFPTLVLLILLVVVVLKFVASPPNINENVPNGEYNNPATATYLDPTRTTPDGTTSVNYDAATVGEEVVVGSPSSQQPERLRSIKRITNVFRNRVHQRNQL